MTIETYYVTPEQMKNVTTYLPIIAKTEWVKLVADKCFEVMESTAESGNSAIPMPPMYKENMEIKSRYLMGVFVRLYLRGTWEVGEGEDEWLMPIDEYDKWAGGHVFGQVEQFKADKELREIAFNLLSDFKDLERRLNCEINGLLSVMNDPAIRILATLQVSMTPEAMQEAMDQLNVAKEELEQYVDERKKTTDVLAETIPGEETVTENE